MITIPSTVTTLPPALARALFRGVTTTLDETYPAHLRECRRRPGEAVPSGDWRERREELVMLGTVDGQETDAVDERRRCWDLLVCQPTVDFHTDSHGEVVLLPLSLAAPSTLITTRARGIPGASMPTPTGRHWRTSLAVGEAVRFDTTCAHALEPTEPPHTGTSVFLSLSLNGG